MLDVPVTILVALAIATFAIHTRDLPRIAVTASRAGAGVPVQASRNTSDGTG